MIPFGLNPSDSGGSLTIHLMPPTGQSHKPKTAVQDMPL